jgi:hypothetical protein
MKGLVYVPYEPKMLNRFIIKLNGFDAPEWLYMSYKFYNDNDKLMFETEMNEAIMFSVNPVDLFEIDSVKLTFVDPTGIEYHTLSFDSFDIIHCPTESLKRNLDGLFKTRGIEKNIKLFTTPQVYPMQWGKYKASKNVDTSEIILLAPTWGDSSLLRKLDDDLIASIKIYAEKNNLNKIVLRPHPQTIMSEKNLLEDVLCKLKKQVNIELDLSSNGEKILQNSHVMITDFSSVVFDYHYLNANPITICFIRGADGDSRIVREVDFIDPGIKSFEEKIYSQYCYMVSDKVQLVKKLEHGGMQSRRIPEELFGDLSNVTFKLDYLLNGPKNA